MRPSPAASTRAPATGPPVPSFGARRTAAFATGPFASRTETLTCAAAVAVGCTTVAGPAGLGCVTRGALAGSSPRRLATSATTTRRSRLRSPQRGRPPGFSSCAPRTSVNHPTFPCPPSKRVADPVTPSRHVDPDSLGVRRRRSAHPVSRALGTAGCEADPPEQPAANNAGTTAFTSRLPWQICG